MKELKCMLYEFIYDGCNYMPKMRVKEMLNRFVDRAIKIMKKSAIKKIMEDKGNGLATDFLQKCISENADLLKSQNLYDKVQMNLNHLCRDIKIHTIETQKPDNFEKNILCLLNSVCCNQSDFLVRNFIDELRSNYNQALLDYKLFRAQSQYSADILEKTLHNDLITAIQAAQSSYEKLEKLSMAAQAAANKDREISGKTNYTVNNLNRFQYVGEREKSNYTSHNVVQKLNR